MIRKIEFSKNGELYHVYRIKDIIDPHNPVGGVEINVKNKECAEFHEYLLRNLNECKEVYVYDEKEGIKKKASKEEFPNLPVGFVKKNWEAEK